MKRLITVLAVSGCCVVGMLADNSPLWLKSTSISPDGKTIAFTFRGDIFTVPVSGGKAFQITTDPAYDSDPQWSPDGKKLVFSSNRCGSADLYIVDAEGGIPQRLTTHSGSEKPLGFLNDSTILFSGSILPGINDVSGFFNSQIYTVPVTGGRPRLYASLPVRNISVDRKGRMLYQDSKGYEDLYRKHERSSGTDDIWLMENDGGKLVFKKLTDFNGHDITPAWGSGDSFFYVSEKDGILNVWERNINGSEKQLTKFEKHPVRSLSASADGKILAFSWDGEIYTLIPGNTPTKVNVTIAADGSSPDSGNKVRMVEKDGAVTSFSVSPDGKEIAFVKNGDVYVTSVKYETTKQVTSTPEQERNVYYSPDGSFLVYDSERNGQWQLYKAERKNPDEKNFTYASELKETKLTDGDKSIMQPVISPDSKSVAFLYNRAAVKILDFGSGKITDIIPEENNYSYEDGDINFNWSPDSKWILSTYMAPMGWNNLDVALAKADGSQVINLTESGYGDEKMKFVLDGKAVAWTSDKQGFRSHGSWGSESDVMVMFLDPDAYTKFTRTEEECQLEKDSETGNPDKKEEATKAERKAGGERVFDIENRKNRMVRLTPASTSIIDYYLNPEGNKLYYIASFDDGYDLYLQDLEKGSSSKIAPNVGVGKIVASADGKKLFIGGDGLKYYDTESEKVSTIPFSAKRDYDPYAERKYIYDHMKTLVAEKFYDKNLHGTNWEMYTEHYSKFLPYINNKFDFANLLSEVLGELNASHTGGRYRPAVDPIYDVAFLGAFFNEDYKGDGLEISEIIKGGPLAQSGLHPGDVIISIDGNKIEAGKDYFPFLTGKVGESVIIAVKARNGKDKGKIKVKPIASAKVKDLLYKRWVRHNQDVVDSISNGTVAYVHVEGMNSKSFRQVYDELLGKYRNRNAVIVDTRHNGGGWLHNDIAVLLSGKEYVTFDPRGHRIGHEPFSRWTKPSAMLVAESNYSDAYGTPYTYKTLNIGPLVGAPIPGTMTAVWWEKQVDPSIVFGIPQVTNTDLNGRPLENNQLDPDFLVYNLPEDVLTGFDRQLEEAVKLFMKNKK